MLHGHSILNGCPAPGNGRVFSAFNPAVGAPLEPLFHSSSVEDVHYAAQLADEAFVVYSRISGRDKAHFLRRIAENIESCAAELIDRAHRESGLTEKRLQVETARTANQLRMFAQLVGEGSWVNARIDLAQPERTPMPRPDVRSMLRPLGPVAVFGASNLPLAFSVAGGDTASALAAGNPVIVKAHPAHPGTSELAGQIIARSASQCDLPAGVFALLFDAGTEIGAALVRHPLVKSVAFTGSLSAGKALMNLAATRPEPIPCYMEMSSTNPFIVLPEALETRAAQIGKDLFASFTLNVGQFCTKPGLVFLPRNQSADTLIAMLAAQVEQAGASLMLTEGICRNYSSALAARAEHQGVDILAQSKSSKGADGAWIAPTLLQTDGKDLLLAPDLAKEVFGPATLIVRYTGREELLALAHALEGQLTATLHASEGELAAHADLVAILERKAGRLIVNGYPTGVEVCHAMVHGGPYPATSDSRTTSVGTLAIHRFARPVCYQNFPQPALPDELKNENPLGIWRTIDGTLTRDPL
jgi:2,5-dioxopentanoate dehydrogenase